MCYTAWHASRRSHVGSPDAGDAARHGGGAGARGRGAERGDGVYGFCRTTIYKWLRQAQGRGKGLRALSARKGTGRPRSLTPAQERQVFRWVNGKNPMQYGFDFGLWTRRIVRELVGSVRRHAQSGLGGGGAGTPGPDGAKALAASLSARPGGHRALEARDLSRPGRRAKADGRTSTSGTNPDFARTCAGQDLGRSGRPRSCMCPDSVRPSAPLRRSIPKGHSGLPPTRRVEWRVVCGPAPEADEPAQQATAPGGGWPARAQDRPWKPMSPPPRAN